MHRLHVIELHGVVGFPRLVFAHTKKVLLDLAGVTERILGVETDTIMGSEATVNTSYLFALTNVDSFEISKVDISGG